MLCIGKSVLFCALLPLSAGVVAADVADIPTQVFTECFDIATVASLLMDSRQVGRSPQAALALVGDTVENRGYQKAAYAYPVMPDLDSRIELKQRFTQLAFNACVGVRLKRKASG